MHRRPGMKLMGSAIVAWHAPLIVAADQVRPKLIWVLLRGGMDSLHALLPLGDSQFARQRKSLVKAVEGGALDISRGFALHPALQEMHGLYRNNQMLAVVATATGNRTRSHFKAQDILECGLPEIDHDSGWVNRAVDAYQGQSLAVAHSTSISLRGSRLAKTWYPDSLPAAEDDLCTRLALLYENDDVLGSRLREGLTTRDQLGDTESSKKAQLFPVLAESRARLMSQDNGPDCGMLEMGGWDTHNNAVPRLNRLFAELDQGIAKLRQGMGSQWGNTVVMVATEFGRTVAENGTKGTDHGTASTMFLAGGAVKGGQLFGTWPGLGKDDQCQGRDLMPTSDIREWKGAVLQQHWGLGNRELARVFPGVAPINAQLVNQSSTRRI